MFIRKSVKVPLYVGYLDIIIGDDKKEYNKIYKGKFSKGSVFAHAISAGCKLDDYRHYVVMLNPNCETTNITYGIIAHEALHIVGFILNRVSVLYDPDNDEAFTYLLEWVVDEIHQFLIENKIEVHVER
jgi:hypothetical protein